MLHSLKENADSPGRPPVLEIGNPPVALLRTVATRPGKLRPDDVRCLTEWRNRYVRSFLTEFVATEERTARWLTSVVGPSSDRILFMLDRPDGQTFGYMGLAFIDWERGYGEADAIVKGGDSPPGTMTHALLSLLDWAKNKLGLNQIGVRVRSDNPALLFYQRCGFVEQHRCPLGRHTIDLETVWREEPTAGTDAPALVHMLWTGRPTSLIQ